MAAIPAVSPLTARRMAIYKQGLHERPAHVSAQTLRDVIRRIGLLQLDSISVTARSHYLVMLSRVGQYDTTLLDDLLPERDLFEHWAHAMCLIPMEDYPYYHPQILARREDSSARLERMGDDPQGLLDAVMGEIRERGPLASRDFETNRVHKGTWWNWKPSKLALEYLFDRGYLLVSHRVNFHRYYDLGERVLDGARPPDSGQTTLEDFEAWATEKGLRHRGVGTAADIADYYRIKKGSAARILNGLIKQGKVKRVSVEGLKNEAYIHVDDLPLLAAIDEGAHAPQMTTFLSPFDNLIWDRDRVEQLFNFYYRVEMYTPAEKRTYGYYVLPILHKDRLVGRIDPKIERKTGTFIIRGLYLEDGIEVDDTLINGLVDAVREFMRFHDCTNFEIENSTSKTLKKALIKQVRQGL